MLIKVEVWRCIGTSCKHYCFIQTCHRRVLLSLMIFRDFFFLWNLFYANDHIQLNAFHVNSVNWSEKFSSEEKKMMQMNFVMEIADANNFWNILHLCFAHCDCLTLTYDGNFVIISFGIDVYFSILFLLFYRFMCIFALGSMLIPYYHALIKLFWWIVSVFILSVSTFRGFRYTLISFILVFIYALLPHFIFFFFVV